MCFVCVVYVLCTGCVLCMCCESPETCNCRSMDQEFFKLDPRIKAFI